MALRRIRSSHFLLLEECSKKTVININFKTNMKKIVLMLLGVAATINVMAVDYTAKAVVTLQSQSGYSCKLTLRQAAEYAALNGLEMNMEGRQVALYALNGTTKLQTAQAADMENVKLGLLADASTSYTLTVSSVAGAETLYIWDADSASYALTEGAVYNFTATASATDEARFVIKKAPLPTVQGICFNYNILTLTKYNSATVEVFADGAATAAVTANVPSDLPFDVDLNAQASGKYKVVVNVPGATPEEYIIDVKPAVTVVP